MKSRGKAAALAFALATSLLVAISPAAHAAPGELDTYLELDGTARYATIASNSAIATFNDISIEFWFKSTAATCSGNIVSKGVDYVVYCTSGILAFAFQGNGVVAGTNIRYSLSSIPTYLTVPQNEWHHFAITRAANTSTATIYWDGQILSSNQSADGAGTSALANSGDPLNIGARRNASTYFTGGIDEVRISNVVRTQSEIQADMHRWGIGNETGVVAYYDFNDISGTSVADRIGSNNLTLAGSPVISRVDSTTQSGSDTIVTFPRSYLTSQGGWKVPVGVSKMESLVVGGGGAGGSRAGGGGGAGGYVATPISTLTFTPGAVETITVGQGGVGQNNARGSNGQNSALGSRRIALGGGSGGSANGTDNTPRNGANGGSGGGAAVQQIAGVTAGSSIQNSTYSYGLGNSGALPLGANYFPGGGGGGSSSAAVVAAASSANDWSDGGNGTANSITGSSICYSTGGGAGFGLAGLTTGTIKSNGGNCGGSANPNNGRGTYGKLAAQWGSANTGAGGGGSGFYDNTAGSDFPGGSGGSGIIVIRYVSTLTATFTGSTTATYRQPSSISISATLASKVTFLANGKRIAGCIAVPTDSSLVATCNWSPSIRGSITVSAIVTPLLAGVSAQTKLLSTTVGRRTGNR